MIIGLTGGIASGKSAASRRFEELGIPVIDADVVSRDVVEPGSEALAAIAAHFGDDILRADGRLDRKKLRGIVFHDPAEKAWLESLLHPLIRDRIRQHLRAAAGEYAILSSPLLLESGQDELVDRVLVIDAPEELQQQRAMARDGSDEATIQAIIDAQMSRRRRCEQASDIIVNDGSPEQLRKAVDEQHAYYRRLAVLREHHDENRQDTDE